MNKTVTFIFVTAFCSHHMIITVIIIIIIII